VLKRLLLTIIGLFVFFSSLPHALATELVVYSARKEHLVKDLFDQYEKESGVKIKYLTGKAAALMQRLKAEGKNTPADIFITVDAGNLWHAAKEGLLQPVDSQTLNNNIPAHLRDQEGRWFGLSIRARTIVYNTDKVTPGELGTYEELADAKWKGRLLLRTSKKVYNQSLVAMLIAEHGYDKVLEIVKGWVGNLAAPPFSNDTKVMESIAAGQGDVGIVNSYYFGRLIKKNPDLPLALYWADQESSGTHVNVSGAGVTAHSRQQAEAVKFMEWLSSEQAQNMFADANMEYPVNPNNTPHPTVQAWGAFKQNMMNLDQAGALQGQAIMLMDRAGYK
jgi:iron(III) transport system substrate-binding protein